MTMKRTILYVGAAMTLLGVWWAEHSKVSAASPSACEEGTVPVAWPLGETGFESQRLLSAHSQFQRFKKDDGTWGTAYVHSGVDIAACEDDPVYAVEDGVVEDLDYVEGGLYNSVSIADLDEEDAGWFYQHLKTISVAKGDLVRRNQEIGTITRYSLHVGFEHLHLQRVRSDPGTEFDYSMQGADDPLSYLAARSDNIPPRAMAFGDDIPEDARFLFFEDIGTEESPDHLPLDEVAGKTVEIVARLRDIFPGPGPTACTTSVCDGLEVSNVIMPRRISFSILKEEEYTTSSGETAERLERIYHNVIDLTRPVYGESDAISLAKNTYRSSSVGYYDEREFLVVLTHCPEDGAGSFKFESGDYVLQLVLEDASGNVGFLERNRHFE